jgi:hypothetical protein
MNSKSQIIYWEGIAVGILAHLKIDFPHYYGPWQPIQSPQYQQFLEAIEGPEGAEVEIGTVGSNLKGCVGCRPDSEIDIRMR